MRTLVVLTVVLAASTAGALDLGGIADKTKEVAKTDTGKAVTQAAADQGSAQAQESLTKKLKNVQNEKGPILFKTGKAVIDPKCDKTMQAIADIIAQFPGFHIQVDGHTDSKGKPAVNQKLSEDRAAAVVKYLVDKKKTDPARLTSKGWGDTQPIADNKTAAGRAKNRRVDFTVTK